MSTALEDCFDEMSRYFDKDGNYPKFPSMNKYPDCKLTLQELKSRTTYNYRLLYNDGSKDLSDGTEEFMQRHLICCILMQLSSQNLIARHFPTKDIINFLSTCRILRPFSNELVIRGTVGTNAIVHNVFTNLDVYIARGEDELRVINSHRNPYGLVLENMPSAPYVEIPSNVWRLSVRRRFMFRVLNGDGVTTLNLGSCGAVDGRIIRDSFPNLRELRCYGTNTFLESETVSKLKVLMNDPESDLTFRGGLDSIRRATIINNSNFMSTIGDNCTHLVLRKVKGPDELRLTKLLNIESFDIIDCLFQNGVIFPPVWPKCRHFHSHSKISKGCDHVPHLPNIIHFNVRCEEILFQQYPCFDNLKTGIFTCERIRVEDCGDDTDRPLQFTSAEIVYFYRSSINVPVEIDSSNLHAVSCTNASAPSISIRGGPNTVINIDGGSSRYFIGEDMRSLTIGRATLLQIDMVSDTMENCLEVSIKDCPGIESLPNLPKCILTVLRDCNALKTIGILGGGKFNASNCRLIDTVLKGSKPWVSFNLDNSELEDTDSEDDT